MGSSNSSSHKESAQSCPISSKDEVTKEVTLKVNDEEEEEAPQFTEDQKSILRCTWTKLHSKIETLGVVTFLRLFETHPKTLTPFLHHINSVKELEMDEW